ncbi:MAG TPA: [citrate (pro-3S)-lyase] ligase [Pelovirga sp.]|nr:[citrate (pro-3S)-lyase] ligase [Pelovirga sp.]
MVVNLINERDRNLARQLVEESGFTFEEEYDLLFGKFEDGELVATAARDHNVFKMICIRESHRGGQCLGELVTALIDSCAYSDIRNFFIFTTLENRGAFAHLNFTPLVTHGKICLLEHGNGLASYLQQHNALKQAGNNGAVVVNCNPFTRGHRYLIEAAAAQVDHLYIFVVREDRSLFPFDVRMALVREGTADLNNVSVLDTSDYAVSQVTFPGYFLKQDDDRLQLQMEIDLLLFARQIAPFFGITHRFIGTEPFCRTTRSYSDTMPCILGPEGIQTIQLERKISGDAPISAFRVRKALRNEDYEALRKLVPAATLEFLRSADGRKLLTTSKNYRRRH